MKIVLVTMPWDQSTFDGPRLPMVDPSQSQYSLGLAYVAASLKDNHDVDLLYLDDYSETEAEQKIKVFTRDKQPDVIGIQILTEKRISSYRLIEYLHDNHPGIKVVIGGIHATILYKQMLNKYPHIIVVVGEGDLTFAELADKLEKGIPIDAVKGIAFMRDGEIVTTEVRPLTDLDTLPFPDQSPFLKGTGRKSACVLTARGCPNACSFCSLNPTAKRMTRYRSPENIVAELKDIVRDYPFIERIFFHDDAFLTDNKRIIRLCELIRENKLPFTYRCQARFRPLSKEVIDALAQTGFERASFGLESGDPTVLKNCHKHTTPEDVIRAIDLFKNTSIDLDVFFIVGLKGETMESIRNTGRLMNRIQKEKYHYYAAEEEKKRIARVYPGTELFEDMKACGQITDDYWLTENPVPVYTAEHTEEELHELWEELRSYLSCDTLFTWRGFKHQWQLIPTIYAFKWRMFWWPRIKGRFGSSFGGSRDVPKNAKIK